MGESVSVCNLAELGFLVYDSLMIPVEFYGLPSLRAGVSRLTLGETRVVGVIEASALRRASLAVHVPREGSLHPAYEASLNGERLVSDRATLLIDGETLLLLSADVGG